jgi:preprotein translocase subunit SecE
MLEKIKKYLKETAGELRKMTWPTKQELIGSTVVVIVVSLVVAVFIGIVDRVLAAIVRVIFGGGLGG